MALLDQKTLPVIQSPFFTMKKYKPRDIFLGTACMFDFNQYHTGIWINLDGSSGVQLARKIRGRPPEPYPEPCQRSKTGFFLRK